MTNYLQPVDNTILAFSKILPQEPNPTKFDKIVEVIKALSVNSIPGVIAQAIDTTAKVCSTFITEKHRVQAVKYVADAYEVKYQSEVELARIKEQTSKNHLITLYIEKSFQQQMDELNKRIILENHLVDTKHQQEMKRISLEHERAIRNMNLIAKEHLHEIDQKYATIIQRNESLCLLYRSYLKSLKDNNLTPSILIAELSRRYMDIIEKSIMETNTTSEKMQAGLEGAMQLLNFLEKSNNYFVPFDKFIDQKRMIEVWNDGIVI